MELPVDVPFRLLHLEKGVAELKRAGDQGDRTSKKFGLIDKSLLSVVNTLGSFLGLMVIVRKTMDAFRLSNEFEASLTRINTLVGVSKPQIAAWRGEVEQLNKLTGRGLVALGDALFVVTSAGERGAGALEILQQSAKASAIGLGETEQIARAVTSVVQAYGKENISASAAVDTLTATVREGNLAAEELAPALGRVLGVAANLGVTFSDVGAFLATYTRLGVNAAEATTALRSVLLQLTKVTKSQEAEAKKLGVDFAHIRDVIRKDGLAQGLVELVEATNGNEEAITRLLPNLRGLSGVLGVAGAQAKEYVAIQERMRDVLGLTEEGFQTWSKTGEASSARLRGALESVALVVGNAMSPAFNEVSEAVEGMVSSGEWKELGEFVGGVFASGAKLVAAALKLVADNVDLIRFAAVALIGTKLVGWVAKLAVATWEAARAFTALELAVGGLLVLGEKLTKLGAALRAFLPTALIIAGVTAVVGSLDQARERTEGLAEEQKRWTGFVLEFSKLLASSDPYGVLIQKSDQLRPKIEAEIERLREREAVMRQQLDVVEGMGDREGDLAEALKFTTEELEHQQRGILVLETLLRRIAELKEDLQAGEIEAREFLAELGKLDDSMRDAGGGALELSDAQKDLERALGRQKEEFVRLVAAQRLGRREFERVSKELEAENLLLRIGEPLVGSYAERVLQAARANDLLRSGLERDQALENQNDDLERQVELLEGSIAALQEGRSALADYAVSQAVLNELVDKGVDLTEAEVQAIKDKVAEIRILTGELDRLKARTPTVQEALDKLGFNDPLEDQAKAMVAGQEEAADLAAEAWKNFLEGVQGAFASTFRQILDGQLSSFRDFFTGVFDLFKDLLAQMAAKAAATKLFGKAGEGGLSDGGKAIFGGVAGGIAIGSILGGIAGNQAGYADAGAVIGAALGAWIGFAVASYFSVGIGGAAGAKIGALIGGAIGGLIGGLIKRGVDRAAGALAAGGDGKFGFGGASGDSSLFAAAEAMVGAVADTLNGILARFGGSVAGLTDKILVNVVGNGWFEVWVNGVKLMFTDVAEEAVFAATVEALKRADLTGLSDVMRAVLKNTKAGDFEGLEADIEVGRAIEQLVEGAGFAVRDAFLALASLMQEASRLGIDAATRTMALVAGLTDLRNSILGISDAGFGAQLAQAQRFNEDLTNLTEETVAEMARLQTMIDAALRREELGIGDLDPNISIPELGDRTARELADQMGLTLEELQEKFDSLQELLDSLPDLIDLQGLAEQLVAEFSGLDQGVSSSLANIHATADALAASVVALGLDAEATAQLLADIEAGRELLVRQLELDVLQNLVNVMSQIPGQAKAAAELQAKIDQARFQIEIEMVAVQLEALNLMTEAFADMLDVAREWSLNLENFRRAAEGVAKATDDIVRTVPRVVQEVAEIPRRRVKKVDTSVADLERLEDFLARFELSDFDQAVRNLAQTFEEARAEAVKLGVDLQRVVDAQATAVRELVASVFDPVREFQAELAGNGDARQGFLSALAEFEDVRARALGGEVDAIQDFPAAAAALLSLARSSLGSSTGAFRDLLAGIQGDTDAILALEGALLGDLLDPQTNALLVPLEGIENWLSEIADILQGNKRQLGGPAVSGAAYLVGKNDDELFVPSTDGTFLASGQFAVADPAFLGAPPSSSRARPSADARLGEHVRELGVALVRAQREARRDSTANAAAIGRLEKEFALLNANLSRTLSAIEGRIQVQD